MALWSDDERLAEHMRLRRQQYEATMANPDGQQNSAEHMHKSNTHDDTFTFDLLGGDDDVSGRLPPMINLELSDLADPKAPALSRPACSPMSATNDTFIRTAEETGPEIIDEFIKSTLANFDVILGDLHEITKSVKLARNNVVTFQQMLGGKKIEF